jgi:hypothetical protein
VAKWFLVGSQDNPSAAAVKNHAARLEKEHLENISEERREHWQKERVKVMQQLLMATALSDAHFLRALCTPGVSTFQHTVPNPADNFWAGTGNAFGSCLLTVRKHVLDLAGIWAVHTRGPFTLESEGEEGADSIYLGASTTLMPMDAVRAFQLYWPASTADTSGDVSETEMEIDLQSEWELGDDETSNKALLDATKEVVEEPRSSSTPKRPHLLDLGSFKKQHDGSFEERALTISNKKAAECDILLLGDSNAKFLKVGFAPLLNAKVAWGTYSGGTFMDLAEVLETVPYSEQIRVVVILAGMNELKHWVNRERDQKTTCKSKCRDGLCFEQTVPKAVAKILRTAKERIPYAAVLLTALCPRSDKVPPAKSLKLQSLLKEACDGHNDAHFYPVGTTDDDFNTGTDWVHLSAKKGCHKVKLILAHDMVKPLLIEQTQKVSKNL